MDIDFNMGHEIGGGGGAAAGGKVISGPNSVPGYDGSYNNTPIMPPPRDPNIQGPDPNDRKEMDQPKPITAEIAKAALMEMCSSNFCYGKRAATEATVQNMSSTSAYYYCVESFTESRTTAWSQIPYTGGDMSVDTAANGPPPEPWSVQIFAKEKFKTEKKTCEVPHTASVKPCSQCAGTGQEKCPDCKSTGEISCSCGKQDPACQKCNGSGRTVCHPCAGKGTKTCTLCKGYKQVKSFIQLNVDWTNHKNDFVHQTQSALPDELIRGSTGQVAFIEENPWVYPISQCPEPAINKASNEILTKHKNDYKNERLLLQRQTVRIVPVTEVQCTWEGKQFIVFIYDLDNKAYSPDYPQKCCFGYCNIL